MKKDSTAKQTISQHAKYIVSLCTLPPVIKQLLKEYELALEALNRSVEKTIPGYLDILCRFFRFLISRDALKSINEISRRDLTDYLLYLQNCQRWPNRKKSLVDNSKLSPFTIRDHARAIKVFWSWLSREEYIDKNPLDKFPLPKVPKRIIKIVTPELFEKLLNLIDRSTPKGAQHFCIMLLLYDAGPRISELVNIMIENIDFNLRTIKVLGKGAKERVIPISQLTIREIRRYLRLFRPQICQVESAYLFPKPDGIPISINSVQQFLRRLAMKAGLDGMRIYPHLFRHSFGTQFIANGGNVAHLQAIMDHESLNTTLQYTHLQTEDLRREHAKFSPVGNLKISNQRGSIEAKGFSNN